MTSVAIYLTLQASASGQGGWYNFGTPLTPASFTWLEIHAHRLNLDDDLIRRHPGLMPLVVAAARDVTPEKVVETR